MCSTTYILPLKRYLGAATSAQPSSVRRANTCARQATQLSPFVCVESSNGSQQDLLLDGRVAVIQFLTCFEIRGS